MILQTGAAAGELAQQVWVYAWEKEALLWVNQYHNPVLDAAMVFISLLGEWGACWIALLLSMLLWGKPAHKAVAVRLGLAMLITSACIVVPLRFLFPRDRPYDVFPQVRQLGLALTGPCFPSGHVQSAWLVAVALAFRWRRSAPWLVLFALLVSYSRLYCGMHYPLDVIVGFLIGAAAGFVLLHVEDRLRHRARPPVARNTNAAV